MWFVARNGQTIGPVTFSDLADAVHQGKLKKEDWLWREGMDAWAPASTVAGLWVPPPLPSGPVTLASDEDVPNEENSNDRGRAAVKFATRIMRSQTGGAIVVGGLVMIALAGLSWLGSANSRPGPSVKPPTSRSDYTTKACEFSVRFPSAPQLDSLSIAIGNQSFNYEQAKLFAAGDMMRAECVPMSIPADDARELLKRQANLDGLENSVITQILPKALELQGYKTIEGEQATYVLRIYTGLTSTLMLGVGNRSAEFPTRNTDAFLLSVRTR